MSNSTWSSICPCSRSSLSSSVWRLLSTLFTMLAAPLPRPATGVSGAQDVPRHQHQRLAVSSLAARRNATSRSQSLCSGAPIRRQ
ncbi:hypothetical protein PF005_g26630 [Phytophthora fragariae]|uniref:RxLR effector protein n=1 Tax=Phytophthora fragariae TaxID=53985 RepID=A0A6A3DPA5_9STRA|nr:hypothetical protein PF009_g27460 [Phytophthora fragariae]KAE8982485.1 hypothetical protein PF011_g21592 [Phytophthora fragariae]KAE9075068.1 hypothetical protein PF010_g24459 [Phytophthora fragariae]KAE9086440.1 hypothetical protein PF006_g26027 [Phytophthora fragariae]KAE9096327.1 hypothetical protein PF007_g17039 [Phytophthora fragariae]